MSDYIEWQEVGGSLTIRPGWFVTNVDMDVDPPILVLEQSNSNDKQTLMIPKPLAYYLRTHFCGSQKMHDLIVSNARHEIGRTIKRELGL